MEKVDEKGISEVKKFKASDYVQIVLIVGSLGVCFYYLNKLLKAN